MEERYNEPSVQQEEDDVYVGVVREVGTVLYANYDAPCFVAPGAYGNEVHFGLSDYNDLIRPKTGCRVKFSDDPANPASAHSFIRACPEATERDEKQWIDSVHRSAIVRGMDVQRAGDSFAVPLNIYVDFMKLAENILEELVEHLNGVTKAA